MCICVCLCVCVCVYLCVYVFPSQRKVFRLRCSCGVLCPEAPVQTDPAPWLQSPHFLSRPRPRYAASQHSRCLLSLPTWWLRSPLPEDSGPEGTLHEIRPAAFPVWCFRASVGWGERVATGHQEEHRWYGHGGREAHDQPQVVVNALTTAADQKRDHHHLAVLVADWSTTLVQTEISHQLQDELPWNLLQIFKVPTGLIIMTSVIPWLFLFYLPQRLLDGLEQNTFMVPRRWWFCLWWFWLFLQRHHGVGICGFKLLVGLP